MSYRKCKWCDCRAVGITDRMINGISESSVECRKCLDLSTEYLLRRLYNKPKSNKEYDGGCPKCKSRNISRQKPDYPEFLECGDCGHSFEVGVKRYIVEEPEIDSQV